MKTYNYKGYTITLNLTGWYTAQISRYGIIKTDTLKGAKELINRDIQMKY
jgi:hypothetical protein